jgi:hypothetical protein
VLSKSVLVAFRHVTQDVEAAPVWAALAVARSIGEISSNSANELAL